MEEIFKAIEHLRARNARHLKKGWRMGDPALEDEDVLKDLAGEVVEIGMAVVEQSYHDGYGYDDTILEECADSLNILIHFCVRRGITPQQISDMALGKLRTRFD